MSTLNGRNVLYLKLTAEFFTPSLGPVGPTMTTYGDGIKFRDLKMLKVDGGVIATMTGPNKGLKFELFLPDSSILGMSLGPA